MKLTSKNHPDKQPAKKVTSLNDLEIPEGVHLLVRAECKSCGCSYTFHGDLTDFDPNLSYCGRSYRCLP